MLFEVLIKIMWLKECQKAQTFKSYCHNCKRKFERVVEETLGDCNLLYSMPNLFIQIFTSLTRQKNENNLYKVLMCLIKVQFQSYFFVSTCIYV